MELVITNSEPQDPGPNQSPDEDILWDGLPIYVVNKSKGNTIVQPLNVPARNTLAHTSPNLIKHAVAESLRRQANKEGTCSNSGCIVHWKPSAIPFHIEFVISVSRKICQHLASVRKIPGKDPVSTHLDALSNGLTLEVGSVRKKSCSTCKAFLKQATGESTAMKNVEQPI